jgi:hypothetical protein
MKQVVMGASKVLIEVNIGSKTERKNVLTPAGNGKQQAPRTQNKAP